jgi:hypothetical protein
MAYAGLKDWQSRAIRKMLYSTSQSVEWLEGERTHNWLLEEGYITKQITPASKYYDEEVHYFKSDKFAILIDSVTKFINSELQLLGFIK